MATKQVRLERKRPARTTTERDNHKTPATDRREVREDIRRTWWPDA